MKLKITLIAIFIILLVSIAINFNQHSEIESLKGFLQVEKEWSKEQSEFVNQLSEEKNNLWNENAQLRHNLKDSQNKQQQRTAMSFETSEGVYYRANLPLEIHSTFSETSAVLGDLPKGAIVEVLESSFSKFWKVKYKDVSGWVITDTRNEVDRLIDEASGNKINTQTLERVK